MKKIFLIFLLSSEILGAQQNVPNLRFHGTIETLETIKTILKNKEDGAYLRFGDGDINVATGVMVFDCLNYNVSSELRLKIAFEMREAFSLNGKNILKTLPLYCSEFGGLEPNMGVHATSYPWSLNIYNKAQPLWGKPISDVYSHIALLFSASNKQEECIDFLKTLKFSADHIILIGNKSIPKEMRDLLFGETCIFIPTPSQGSFFVLDELESQCLAKASECPGYKIIITSTGCAGRILQKRLRLKIDNAFFFDFGSLMDGLCGEIEGLYRADGFEERYHCNRNSLIKKLQLFLQKGA